MFKKFKSKFKESSSVENPLFDIHKIPFKYKELLLDCGGKSFDNGLYSIHTFKDSLKWTDILTQYFEKYKDGILSFAHDWMGRQFCIPVNANECVYMFDPATQKIFLIEENLFDFHNELLVNSKIETLDSDIFEQVCNYLKIYNIEYNKCIGFKTSLFLGGKADLSNYEINDIEVYWDFEHQLYQQVEGLPDGTRINNVTINPFT